jgi:hypothetical protein
MQSYSLYRLHVRCHLESFGYNSMLFTTDHAVDSAAAAATPLRDSTPLTYQLSHNYHKAMQNLAHLLVAINASHGHEEQQLTARSHEYLAECRPVPHTNLEGAQTKVLDRFQQPYVYACRVAKACTATYMPLSTRHI